jgi:hypothetical protein
MLTALFLYCNFKCRYAECCYSECRYAECRFFIDMLSIIMLSVFFIRLSVILLRLFADSCIFIDIMENVRQVIVPIVPQAFHEKIFYLCVSFLSLFH